MTKVDQPGPVEPTAEEKAAAKETLEQDLPKVEASPEQAAQSDADRERMLIARVDPLVPLPSPGSVRHPQQKGALAGEPDPLKPRDGEAHTEDRDPLVPDIPSIVEPVPLGLHNFDTREFQHTRRRDPDTGRIEGQDEANERSMQAERAAAKRRERRRTEAQSPAEREMEARAQADAESKTMTKPNTETGADEGKGGDPKDETRPAKSGTRKTRQRTEGSPRAAVRKQKDK